MVEQKWAARHEKEGQAVHDMLLDLSGLYVKSAQILASKGDFMPEPWCRRLAAMFDSMPPKPWAHIARVCHGTANAMLPLLRRCACHCASSCRVAGLYKAFAVPDWAVQLCTRHAYAFCIAYRPQSKSEM